MEGRQEHEEVEASRSCKKREQGRQEEGEGETRVRQENKRRNRGKLGRNEGL